jgi:DNA polymerase elongation subunit (family B)
MTDKHSYRLLTFNVYDEKVAFEGVAPSPNSDFLVQMFGMNERGETATIFVTHYEPFFYIKVPPNYESSSNVAFTAQIKRDLRGFPNNCISSVNIVKQQKLYGFDGGKKHNFLLVKFRSEAAMRKAKNLWFTYNEKGESKLKPQGYLFDGKSTYLYEAQIPPLLRMFHIKSISPSGWINLPADKCKPTKSKTTSCTFEYLISYEDIVPLPNKVTIAPFKICSFDIEASSSHGDFPLAVKNYNKLATNIVDLCEDPVHCTSDFLKRIVLTAFGFDNLEQVDTVYPIRQDVKKAEVLAWFTEWIKVMPVIQHESSSSSDDFLPPDMNFDLDDADDGTGDVDADVEEGEVAPENQVLESAGGAFWQKYKPKPKPYLKKGAILDLLLDADELRETKLLELNRTLAKIFPKLQGDIVTFIGSTFLRYGDDKPYLNHCLVKDSCADVPGAVIQTCKSEKDVLLQWAALIQKEDPDIIIGYNIFGFDYQFMYLRAKELACENDFLKLSRQREELCLSKNWKTGKVGLEESTIVIASGEHNLKFVRMTGRLQIDMYNYLRRDYSLNQYNLDYVAGYFLGDKVKKIEYVKGFTKIYSSNLTGLEDGGYVKFEEEAHSVDAYRNGQKFMVHGLDRSQGTFLVMGEQTFNMQKAVKWGLAKDDVSPQEIFRLTNEGPNERALIAKYCIQDCNLVHHLMRKIDVMTGYSEMAALCSVPLDFLVMRGQGIKLTSYVAKKCREKGALMPVLDKGSSDEGYEGAMVLEPKCNLYLEDPVACVDYGSLYPSSMISENISHDSKVLTREYDLGGKLIKETGEKNAAGHFIYDNLPGYKYVDIMYNTYKWQHKGGNVKAKMESVITGQKVCRFAQYQNDPKTGQPSRAIMPAILQELLAARKATRKLIEKEPDEFMKNILDKRQLSIKVTANSLYGQTGAKTSSFYEQDCAASTTAMGRTFLVYAQAVIEEGYKNATVQTKYGLLKTNAEYVYGDTDSVFFKFNLTDLEGNKIIGQQALEITIDLAQEAGALATKFLKYPHDLEYEKTFYPFCLLRKKGYVGMLYEYDAFKCKRKSMGVVLKRRDNAPIVKDIYGGVIDILMREKDIPKAVAFLRDCLTTMVDGKYGMDKLIVTKSLKSGYKKPKQIAHKVLADRMGRRDAGNKPNNGDRIAYVFIKNADKRALQGEKIETPEFILAQKLKIDYTYYITNQIMVPILQLFALVLEDMREFKKKKGVTLRAWYAELQALKREWPEESVYKKKEEALRQKEVKALLFDEFLYKAENVKNSQPSITNFFGGTAVSHKKAKLN